MAVKKAAAPAPAKAKKVDQPASLDDFINEVKAKAFDIYLKRASKGIGGDEISDWVAAEKEIKAKYKIK